MTTPVDVANAIIDNRDRRVGDYLRGSIEAGSNLSIVSAYFSIYAYEALRDTLEAAGPVRFLYGEPQGIGAPDPKGKARRFFNLTEAGGIELGHVLAQKALARACAAWLDRQVEVRPSRDPRRQGRRHNRAGGRDRPACLRALRPHGEGDRRGHPVLTR